MKETLKDPVGPAGAGLEAAAAALRRGKYKAWALAAILLLAFWSMLTGSVTLNFSSHRHGLLLPTDDLIESPLYGDLDILEMEEREKAVRRTWELYLRGETRALPRFWQEAFGAAYEDLAGDDDLPRAAAVAEIARMSLRMMTAALELEVDRPDVDKKGKEKSGSDTKKARKLINL